MNNVELLILVLILVLFVIHFIEYARDSRYKKLEKNYIDTLHVWINNVNQKDKQLDTWNEMYHNLINKYYKIADENKALKQKITNLEEIING